MQIVWTQAARAEANDIFQYLVERNPQTAEKTATAILTGVEKLADFPRLGRPGRVEGTRELVITRLPYIVVYAVGDMQITVLRVLRGAQAWPPETAQDADE